MLQLENRRSDTAGLDSSGARERLDDWKRNGLGHRRHSRRHGVRWRRRWCPGLNRDLRNRRNWRGIGPRHGRRLGCSGRDGRAVRHVRNDLPDAGRVRRPVLNARGRSGGAFQGGLRRRDLARPNGSSGNRRSFCRRCRRHGTRRRNDGGVGLRRERGGRGGSGVVPNRWPLDRAGCASLPCQSSPVHAARLHRRLGHGGRRGDADISGTDPRQR
jgi:hypothetical protein